MTFQNLCLLSAESHKLDGWMVGFLLEHALVLKKRWLPNFDLESGCVASKARELAELGRYTNFESL